MAYIDEYLRKTIQNIIPTQRNKQGGKMNLINFLQKGSKIKNIQNTIYNTLAAPIHSIFGNPGYTGGYGGGKWNGSGVEGRWNPEYYYNEIIPADTLLVPIQENFNQAFAKARAKGLDRFVFNGKTYTTEMSSNPNWKQAGDSRIQESLVPVFLGPDTIRHTSSTPHEDIYRKHIVPVVNEFKDGGQITKYQKGQVIKPYKEGFFNNDLGRTILGTGLQLYEGIRQQNNIRKIGDELQEWKKKYVNSVQPEDVSQQVAQEEELIKQNNPDYNISPIVQQYKQYQLQRNSLEAAKRKASLEADQIINQKMLQYQEQQPIDWIISTAGAGIEQYLKNKKGSTE